MLRRLVEEKDKLIKLLSIASRPKINSIVKEKEKMISIENKSAISEREVRELKERIKAMTPEELAIVADAIPVELCLARVHSEIDRAKELEESIKNMAAMMRGRDA